MTIIWDENETPLATRFDDPYYSKQDGRAESAHVFIKGNDLDTRFAATKAFHVAELGFGTGLNFTETLSHWQAQTGGHTRLIFTSFELYPLAREEILRALTRWPDLAGLILPFLEQLTFQEGWQEITVGTVTLRLGVGDANRLVTDIIQPADAWFLDGFSPAKNPELWNQYLMNKVYGKTAQKGSFATYTAAGWVRRMLEEAGFNVKRIKGFGTKRHMSIGWR